MGRAVTRLVKNLHNHKRLDGVGDREVLYQRQNEMGFVRLPETWKFDKM